MRTLEYGTGHEKTLLFLPCTAEPEWAFTDSVGLLSQDYHVMQIVYDGHGETGEDFISVETTVDEVTDWLQAHGITRLNAAYGCSLGGACLTRFLALGKIPVERAVIDDLQNQSIQHAKIQILRPAEDHPIDLNGWGSLQKNSRSAAQRLCIKQVQPSVQFFFNISRQLVRLSLSGRVSRFACSVKAVETDGIHAEFPFQQRDQVLKLLPAHKISVQ